MILGLLDVISRRYRRCQSAATAVEFAFVLPVFLLLVAGIFHYGFVLLQQQAIDDLATKAARSLMTTSENLESANDFRIAAVCPDVGLFIDCDDVEIGADVFTNQVTKLARDRLFATWCPGISGETVLFGIRSPVNGGLLGFANFLGVDMDGETFLTVFLPIKREPLSGLAVAGC